MKIPPLIIFSGGFPKKVEVKRRPRSFVPARFSVTMTLKSNYQMDFDDGINDDVQILARGNYPQKSLT